MPECSPSNDIDRIQQGPDRETEERVLSVLDTL